MAAPIYTVAAFTTEPTAGNLAAVCVCTDRDDVSEPTMLRVAKQMNLSETSFVQEWRSSVEGVGEGEPVYSIRWFTPQEEVPLCGHATLASAHALVSQHAELVPANVVHFMSKSGRLTVRKVRASVYSMDFPMNVAVPIDVNEQFVKATAAGLGIATKDILHAAHNESNRKLLLHCSSVDVVLNARISEAELLSIDFGGRDVKGVIATTQPAESDAQQWYQEGYTCVSRYFAPWVGIPEDPVTGSAHTVIGPYWSQFLSIPSVKAFQASSRGGTVNVLVRESEGRVTLEGAACTVEQGTVSLEG